MRTHRSMIELKIVHGEGKDKDMSRKDKIFQCICRMAEKQENWDGIDSMTISEELSLDRSNVSRDLNELVREDKIVKIIGRPVRFLEKAQYEKHKKEKKEEEKRQETASFEFDFMVGQNGSLKNQIEQGKSAMLYPPRGLHTLLAGPTGTGKTTFAEKLYEYAIKIHAINAHMQFVVFNCAEYAQNPQLILSQLFGHRKGAFTGAEKDKPGLVEKANGGILFLDEIHRLPPEGQEMLFLLMDKGVYRRLGETDEFRKASVLIIGATTENLNTSLLKTFLRRMPVVIHLPALEERPLVERLQLIETFFSNEQKKIGVPIRVYKEVLIALLLYHCSGNIGQLQADIQLLCARAFLQYKVEALETVTIDMNILPEYIQNGRLTHKKQKNDLIEFLRYSDDYHIFNQGDMQKELEETLYDQISKKYQEFKTLGRSEGQISGILQEELDEYMNQLMERYHVTVEKDGTKNLLKIIDAKIYYAVEEVLQFAEVKLNRRLTDQVRIGMAMHVNAMIERLEKGILVKGDKVNEIALNHPKEFRVAKIILRLLEEELNLDIPKQELGYLTMFLCIEDEEEQKHVGVIVLAHGNTTATSMADVVNQLMDTEHCKAIDMPLNVSVERTLEKTIEMVQTIDEGKGVILLVDMGSLTMFGDIIEQKTGVKVRTISMTSTATVVEAVRKSFMKGVTLDELALELNDAGKLLLGEEHLTNSANAERKNIITTCFSGQGTAVKIKQIIDEILPKAIRDKVSIRCMDFKEASDIKNGIKGLERKKITAVVGTVDLQLEGVPFISVDELIIGSGTKRLERLISGETTETQSEAGANQEKINADVLVETLRGMLQFLNPEKLVPILQVSFDQVMGDYVGKRSKEMQVRYIIHVACMFERVIQREVLPYKQMTQMKQKNLEVFELVRSTLYDAEQMMHISIPDSEIAYLVEMITE